MQLDRRTLLAGAGAAALLGGCVTTRRPFDDSVSRDLLQTTADNQVATYANAHRLWPSRAILRGSRVLPLAPHATSVDRIAYDYEGAVRNVDQYMADNRCTGLIIVKDGRVALERYGMGACPRTLWTGFSVSKPVTSTLAGVALADDAFRSLDDPAGRYAPALRGTAYEEVTIRNLLRLESGVSWDEDYATSGGAGLEAFNDAATSGDRRACLNLMRARPRAAPQGAVFNYNTGEAYILGEVIRAATRMNLCDYLSAAVWARLGMERNAYWLTCGQGGPELAGYGLSACLRDYARFGLFILRNGLIRGARMLPHGWRELAGQPDNPVSANGALEEGYPIGHAYMWWSMPTGADALPNHDGAFSAQGIHGQFIYVNPRENVVAAIWSAWRDSWNDSAEFETYALLGGAIERLRA